MNNTKEITLLGLQVKGSDMYMYLDSELPKDKSSYYKIMEQFDIPEENAKEIINKVKRLALDIEYLLGMDND